MKCTNLRLASDVPKAARQAASIQESKEQENAHARR